MIHNTNAMLTVCKIISFIHTDILLAPVLSINYNTINCRQGWFHIVNVCSCDNRWERNASPINKYAFWFLTYLYLLNSHQLLSPISVPNANSASILHFVDHFDINMHIYASWCKFLFKLYVTSCKIMWSNTSCAGPSLICNIGYDIIWVHYHYVIP